jgi:hypothetical protein
MSLPDPTHNPDFAHLLQGKSEYSLRLLRHLLAEFSQVGDEISLHPAKTMMGITTPRKRIAWITQIGKNFVHVVFPFREAHPDNLCFQKIAQVPGEMHQFNHHFRMLQAEDVNEEVRGYMRKAYEEGL